MTSGIQNELFQNLAEMSMLEKGALIALCGLAVLLYGYAAWIVLSGAVRWIYRRVRLARATPERTSVKQVRRSWFWRVLRGATLVLAAAGLACVVDAFYVEPYWPEVTRFEARSDKLPAGGGFVRVVHISDTHCDGDTARLEDDLPAVIGRLNPDLVVWTGDAANDAPGGLDRFKRMMTRIAEIAPTCVVNGNWDAGVHQLFAGTGVKVVDGLPVNLDIRGARLCLAGGMWGQPKFVFRSLDRADPTRYIILLYHMPDIILDVEERVKKHGGKMPDLFLAGHTHGGQIRLPFYGALVTQQKTGKLFENGLVDYNGTKVHVSRGIGMNGQMPRVRFLCRPEVAVIDLHGEGP